MLRAVQGTSRLAGVRGCVTCGCAVSLAGAADEKGDGEAEEEAAAEAEGEEGSALPAWPKYDGLAYQSELQLPCGAADIAFPPPSAVVATI